MLMKDKSRAKKSASSAAERESAETLAIAVLGFLAAQDDRLLGFLDATGLDPAAMRDAAGSPDFLVAVLEHLASDESLLLTFAAGQSIDPGAVLRARARLAGPLADGLREG
jgi:hypothetical protein